MSTASETGLALLRVLWEAISYCPTTGTFRHLAAAGRWGHIPAGSLAGSSSHGYRTLVVEGRRYQAHRLAWLMTHGVWPNGEIDHINGVRDDNRLENLRDIPKLWNGHNRQGPNKDNKSSGLLGVTKNGKVGWMAQITVNGRRMYLGTYRDSADAHDAYLTAKRQMHDGCTI
jgi:hypothetical protein